MPRHDRTGRHYREAADFPEADATLTGLGTAAVHAAGAKAAFDLEGAEAISMRQVITAVGATPTMTLNLEASVDGSNWVQLGTWGAKTATGNDERAFPTLGYSQARFNVIANTNVTFRIDRLRFIRP